MAMASGFRRKEFAGFTMIEVMVTVAIVGILAAIALPSYSEYIMRSKIIDGTTKLGDFKSKMDKYFSDNRTYLNTAGTACGILPPAPNPGDYFAVTCLPPPVVTATTYTAQANGIAAKGMSGFIYTVDQANNKSSVGPAGWVGAPTCWAVRKDGSC
jgi:type IV pilus assembly protein PilE